MDKYVYMKSLSRVQLFATLWTIACQAPPSMGFFRQEYWSRLPFSSPGDLPDPGIEPTSPALWVDYFYHFATREVQELRREALKSQCSDLREEVTAQLQVIFVREHMGLVLHVLKEPRCLGQDPMLR